MTPLWAKALSEEAFSGLWSLAGADGDDADFDSTSLDLAECSKNV